jgi:hypothetical protein
MAAMDASLGARGWLKLRSLCDWPDRMGMQAPGVVTLVTRRPRLGAG